MALELVTGYKGQNHVTADQWADFNRSIYGNAAILPVGNKMAVEIQTANQITVKDGVAVFDGRQIYIGYGESENVAIESGTQAMLRNDIVVVKYTKNEETGVESVAFEAITGTPAASDPVDPSYQDMDIRTGVFTSQKAFCRVRLNGVAIEGIDMLVDVKEIKDHAFEVPANNLTTATPGTALDAAMGKKLQEEYDQLNGDITKLEEKIKQKPIILEYKTYKSGAVAKGGVSEIPFSFEPKQGYTRNYYISQVAGTGSNTATVNLHAGSVSFYAEYTALDMSVVVACMYTKD